MTDEVDTEEKVYNEDEDDEDDDIVQSSSPTSPPIITRIQGPGLRCKMKKKDIIEILLNKLNDVPPQDLKVLYISMMFGKVMNNESTFGVHDSATMWKIFMVLPHEQLRDLYFDKIKDKPYDFEVIGGSVLSKFLRKYKIKV